MPSHIELVRANYSRRSDLQGELREIDEAATTDNRDYTDAESGRIAEIRSELTQIEGRITANLEMAERNEQIDNGLSRLLGTMVDRDDHDLPDTRSLGERFVGDGYAEFVSGGATGSYRREFDGVSFRTVADTTTSATSGGAWISNERLPRVGMDNLDRQTFLVDVLPHIAVSTGSIEYVQDKSPTADLADKAAETTEGSAKPQAGITTAVVTEASATIAAWVNITRQVAADVPQIQSYLDGRLRYSLHRRVDGQAIAGNGTSPNLKGLESRTGIATYAPSAAEAWYKTIRHAITVGETNEAVYQIVVLNPADAEKFDLSNDTTAGLHAVMDVAGPGARTAWGLTQVRSNAIASGTALLIDPMAVAVLDRQAPVAYLTDSHASNFTSNILTLLLECRVGLALFDPKGVCKVTFNAGS